MVVHTLRGREDHSRNGDVNEMNQVWDTIMVANPFRYINIGLYNDGHLDNNNMLSQIDNVLQVTPKSTNELGDILKNLGQESQPKPTDDFKIVVINPNQKVNTLMEVGEINKSPPQGATSSPKTGSTINATVHNDSNSRMSSTVIDNLQHDMRCKRDLLKKEDMDKYKGDKKFNPKSFKSGLSVGYI